MIRPRDMLEKIEHYIPRSPFPVLVQDRWFYMTSPEYLQTYAQCFVQLGARSVGGCCGTGAAGIHRAHQTPGPGLLSRDAYWVERLAIELTEQLLEHMETQGITLARYKIYNSPFYPLYVSFWRDIIYGAGGAGGKNNRQARRKAHSRKNP